MGSRILITPFNKKSWGTPKRRAVGTWWFIAKKKGFAPSDKLEKTCHGTLDVYDEETFWEELVGRLALRDIEQERGPDALEKMSAEILLSVISEVEERYQTECERHGLDRLEVVEE